MVQKLYTAQELGKILKRDPHTVRDWINHGCPTGDKRVKLPARKLGRSWFVTEEDLAVFLVRARSSSHGRPDLDLGKKEEIQEDGQ
jgi:hypothetical protein